MTHIKKVMATTTSLTLFELKMTYIEIIMVTLHPMTLNTIGVKDGTYIENDGNHHIP